MKKTIATTLLIVSSMSVHAETIMKEQKEFTTMCLQSYTLSDSSISLMDCDSTQNNKTEKLKLAQNGCAKDQVAIRVLKTKVMDSCYPPGLVQL